MQKLVVYLIDRLLTSGLCEVLMHISMYVAMKYLLQERVARTSTIHLAQVVTGKGGYHY